MLYDNLAKAVGQTPLIPLKNLNPEGTQIYAKLESFNPTGSVKDRPAFRMIWKALEKGELRPGQTVIEPTSGNTGISLAFICKTLGHPFKAVMPENVTPERKNLIAMYGAEIIYSPGNEGSNGAIRLAQEIKKENSDYYMPYQYGNEENPEAHRLGTAQEIIEDLPGIDVFVAGLGTGGTLMGVGKTLKNWREEIEIVASEPEPGQTVDGLRSLEAGFIPPILDLSVLNRKILVSNEESIHWTRKLLHEEGLFLGVSAGSNMAAAWKTARKGQEIVVLMPDDGWRYLSSGIYTSDKVQGLDTTVWW